ncbi:MAG: DUF2752 domain-containing protein [Prevotella sp.]|nr:DUF2752 domain-containing protein [Prevotella sp.]
MRPWKIVLLAAMAVVFAMLYYVFDPTREPLFPKCFFLSATGYKCAGCGLQRAIHSLLHFNVGQALHYNAFFVAFLPVLLLLLTGELWRNRLPKLFDFLTSFAFVGLLVGASLAWWVLRNVFGW